MARAYRRGSAARRLTGSPREPSTVAVYDGLKHLGSIALGETIRARAADGADLGTYPTRDEARAAVRSAAERPR